MTANMTPLKELQRCSARNSFLEERGIVTEIVVFNRRGTLRPGGFEHLLNRYVITEVDSKSPILYLLILL